ncbi:MAG: hypothetical protein ABEH47_05940 [Haloferacaceae archaeon]
MSPRGRRLAVEADLDVSVGGEAVRVDGYGDLVVVDAASFAALRALRRGSDALPTPLGPALAADADLTVDLRVRGVSVARVDPDVDPGPLARALGVAPVRPSLGGLVRAALRSVRA